MADGEGIFIGKGGNGPEVLVLRRANRHGLIAGATGTGKTVTLQGIAEDFSRAGVPVFVADVKGDLSGLAMAGSAQSKLHAAFAQRAVDVDEMDWSYGASPAIFWDLFGEQGHPIRATISEMGPLLLARLMDLNEVQEGVLTIAFHVADKEGLLLLDLDDLQAMLANCAARADELTTTYGNVSKASVGSIQRALLQLRSQGAEHFFGEPAVQVADFMQVDEKGRGYVSILAADKLMASPSLYATFLLWLLSELFEALPEVGDPDKPVLVFFFDEAHLLFDGAPKALEDKIEQVVRLIRSKGVGVYFITQNPVDVPDAVAGQLGNRVQHGLHAFTPRDQAAVRAAAETFRANAGVDVATVITELKTGEALVSLLQEDGAPSPVECTLIKPPRSRVGPVTADERRTMIDTSPVAGKYETPIDRESAEEVLAAKNQVAASSAAAAKAQAEADKAQTVHAKAAAQAEAVAQREAAQQARIDAQAAVAKAHADAQPSTLDKMVQSAGRAVASSAGRQITNAVLRGVIGGGRSRSSGGLAGTLLRGVFGNLLK